MKVGVILPMSEDGDTGQTPRYVEIRERALTAERVGLDSIWCYDHLLYRFGENAETRGTWEVWTVLTGLAEATERIELGTLVMCVPFRNPSVLAKMASTLDEVSDGRFILGLGAGWHQPEFDAFGIPFDHKADRFEEALEIIGPLLREGHVDVRGAYYSAPNAELRPLGPRPAGPPILIAASGPRMLRLTAKHADLWNTAWLGQPNLLAQRRRELEAACADMGRDPATLAVTVGVTVAFPDLLPEEEEASSEAPDPAKVLRGSTEEIAAGLRAYADQGVAHV
ncbi:MAG TPA: LLM class flavin-dependent oxidoreductase, partial [Thermomicrobiales bacterium]|nr:LLM class flavin-dependent oxidoreductase [Thermomicrobiales bacterium]